MKKILSCLALFGVLLGCLIVAGCGDPTKPAGPGGARQQSYDSGTGQYK